MLIAELSISLLTNSFSLREVLRSILISGAYNRMDVASRFVSHKQNLHIGRIGQSAMCDGVIRRGELWPPRSSGPAPRRGRC